LQVKKVISCFPKVNQKVHITRQRRIQMKAKKLPEDTSEFFNKPIKEVNNDFELKGGVDNGHFAVYMLSAGQYPMTSYDLNVIYQLRAQGRIVLVVAMGQWEERSPKNKQQVIRSTDEYYARLREVVKDEPDVYASELVFNSYKGYINSDTVQDSIKRAIAEYSNSLLLDYDLYEQSDNEYSTLKTDLETNTSEKVSFAEIPRIPGPVDSSVVSNYDILPPFKTPLVILVSGAESTGKTTLVHSLAKLFDLSYSTEYGRDITETWRHTQECNISTTDYLGYLAGQLKNNEDAIANVGSHNGVILDTDAIVTKEYFVAQYEMGNIEKRDYDLLMQAYKKYYLFTAYNADVVLLTNPKVGYYKYDGSRDGTFKDVRDTFTDKLYSDYANLGLDAKVLSMGNGEPSFLSQYNDAMRTVSRWLLDLQ